METTKKLVMTFLSDEDRKVSLSIEDPRPNVTENEIKECMELIVARDVFVPNGEALVKAVEAKVVVTDTTAYDLVL